MNERYDKEQSAPDYHHHFHAGNVGDVWKHCVLCRLLEAVCADPAPIMFRDCHSGQGSYRLGPTGEWREGIGRLLGDGGGAAHFPRALQAYLSRLTALGFDGVQHLEYPGSPVITLSYLRSGDRFQGYDTNPEAAAVLRGHLGSRDDVQVLCSDGLAALVEPIMDGANYVALVDPPWKMKQDWTLVPRAVLEAWRRFPSARLVLWYPIKSYTRVAAMLKMFKAEKLPFAALDLITTPLEYQRNRLNGSGVLLVNAPAGVVEDAAHAGTVIGQRCAVFSGQWRMQVEALLR